MALAGSGVFRQLVGIDSLLTVNGTEHIGNGYDLHAFVKSQLGGPTAYIAEALYGSGSAFHLHAFYFQGFQGCGHHTPAGSRRTAQGAAQGQILAGDEAGFVFAGDLAVFVHHPAHDLGIGVHVRSRNVFLLADDACDLIDVAPGQGFQFPFRQFVYVYDDAALAAAVGKACHCALAGHPEGQGLHFVHVNRGMIPHAALGRSHDGAVLAAVARKHLDFSVVHLHRDVYFRGLFRHRNDGRRARIQLHRLNCLVQRNHRLFDQSHDSFPLT